MDSKQIIFSQNKWLVVTVIVLIFLCILVISTKIAVEQCVRNQLVLVGEQLTGRQIETDSVIYYPLFCELIIAGMKVKNPPGYSRENAAIEIKRISVKIAPWAAIWNPVHIRELHMSGVSLYPELKKIPITSSDGSNLFLSPEINLADFARPESQQEMGRNTSLWFLKVDDFTVSDVKVHFVNIRKLKNILPEKFHDYLPHVLSLAKYQQLNLGADGKHTGPMIAKEILNRHLDELKQWYETRKETLKTELKKACRKRG